MDGEGIADDDGRALDEKELRKRDKQEKRSRGDAPIHMSCLGGEWVSALAVPRVRH